MAARSRTCPDRETHSIFSKPRVHRPGHAPCRHPSMKTLRHPRPPVLLTLPHPANPSHTLHPPMLFIPVPR
ncbi:hypothetical protein OF83DRAFT_1100219 [Amylostereum chailletii]|nr:hypothetical protein OF83DRAFT_1100219 [Amylostereum chailletii]